MNETYSQKYKITGFILVFSLLVLSDFSILLDLPIFRQFLGLFLLLLPGLLLLFVLKLDKLGLAEKIMLTIGLSIAFLMLYGYAVNQISLSVGYTTPLSTNFLVIAFNIPLIILLLIAYLTNQRAFLSFPFRAQINLQGKIGLLIPSLLPLLIIIGMYVLNASGNNIILLFSLCLVPVSLIIIVLLRDKISKDSYPLIIILITFSLISIFWLRSQHIIGVDVQTEYYIFQATLSNQHVAPLGLGVLDSCLSISLLPAIFQSIQKISSQEILFKGIYVFICTFTPLAVYVISSKYIKELYAFLASLLFTFQLSLLETAGSARTNLALFFFALSLMVIFINNITQRNRVILFLFFIVATIISHYSSTYIFLFILALTYLLTLVFRKNIKRVTIPFILITIFSILVFIWYSEITVSPFRASVNFTANSMQAFTDIFSSDIVSRGKQAGLALGGGDMNILDRIYLIFTWLIYVVIAAGIIGIYFQRSKTLAVNQGSQILGFLKTRLNLEFYLMALVCGGILAASILLPYISKYGLTRSSPQLLVILSTFFILGGMMLSRYLKLSPHWIILVLLIPYFMFVTGAGYGIFGVHEGTLRSEVYIVALSSKSIEDRYELVYNQENISAKWLKNNYDSNEQVYAGDDYGQRKLISQGPFDPRSIGDSPLFDHELVNGYIWLSYDNTVFDTLTQKRVSYDINNYSDIITTKNEIYNNGGSEIWK